MTWTLCGRGQNLWDGLQYLKGRWVSRRKVYSRHNSSLKFPTYVFIDVVVKYIFPDRGKPAKRWKERPTKIMWLANYSEIVPFSPVFGLVIFSLLFKQSLDTLILNYILYPWLRMKNVESCLLKISGTFHVFYLTLSFPLFSRPPSPFCQYEFLCSNRVARNFSKSYA